MAVTPSVISLPFKIIAGVIAGYAIFIGALTQTPLGKVALYANQVNTLFWHDLNYPDQFGFSDGQVTPFNIETPDGQILYAWHVLPLDVYARHEQELRTGKRHQHPVKDFTKTLAYKLLTENREAPPRVVISYHGNAGHLAQGQRAGLYRALSLHSNAHTFTIDYRAFGHSTSGPDGPTEAGLIVDGTTLVNYVLQVAGIPAEQITLVGQSLGTAVASSVALNFASPENSLIPRLKTTEQTVSPGLLAKQVDAPKTFAGVVLVAPFSSIPSLLLTYRMGGWVPLMLPLSPFPSVAKYFASFAPDTWYTALKLAEYRRVLRENPKLLASHSDDTAMEKGSLYREMGAIQIVHALNDRDISYHQTEMICREVVGPDQPCIDGADGPALFELKNKGEPRFRFELYPFGGHNTVVDYSPVALAIIRCFNGFPAR